VGTGEEKGRGEGIALKREEFGEGAMSLRVFQETGRKETRMH
jgi:hypothetical protein